MQRDIRDSELYKEAEALYRTFRAPGTGQISDAAEIHASPDGRHATFAATLIDAVDSAPTIRLAEVTLSSGELRVLTFGPHTDRLPKYSPDGKTIAFLSDRHNAGDFQLYLLSRETGAARAAPRVEGWAEYFHWSPDGTRILLGVAGHGADIAGGHGAITSGGASAAPLPWMPLIQTGDESYHWRRAWVYELETDSMHPVPSAGLNIWEAVWCGDSAIAAVVSSGPGEGLWYGARLALIEPGTGDGRDLHIPKDQLGWPAASPSGRTLAFVEAVSSDRWIVAGDVKLLEIATGRLRSVDTAGVDVTHLEWRSENRLLIAGHRGFETVIGLYALDSGSFTPIWSSSDCSTGGFYATVSGAGESGDCVLIGEGFTRAPEIAVIRSGDYQVVRSFYCGSAAVTEVVGGIEQLTWAASDGVEVQGWLLRPKTHAPHPLVMHVHGGPVWHWRPAWLGRRHVSVLMQLARGYAVFLPNPRGSSGRGQGFIRRVIGDPGGGDSLDFLSGIDHLVERGIADAKRLGITGGSYGGYISSWLITQDTRFAAAVPVAPVTNWVTEHLISNIPHFVSLCLADTYARCGGNYFTRSPVMHAHKVRTPTLNICGALDRCTPPGEAMQFHNALLENGVNSVLLTYPEEGHGIRKFPAAIDYAARATEWFVRHFEGAP